MNLSVTTGLLLH